MSRQRARMAKAEQQLLAIQPAEKPWMEIEPEDWSRLDDLDIPPGVSYIYQRGCSPDTWDDIQP